LSKTLWQSGFVLLANVYNLLHLAKYFVHGLDFFRGGGGTTDGSLDRRGRITALTDFKSVSVGRSFDETETIEFSGLKEVYLITGLTAEVVVAGFHHSSGLRRLLLLFLQARHETCI
jgi:hypothetical protein